MSADLFTLMRELCKIPGPSGREDKVWEYIADHLPAGTEINTDALGNLYVHKKGKAVPEHKIALFAHMDEVGLIITHIDGNGMLRFNELGGVDQDVIVGRTVVLESGVTGVIGLKPIHLCHGDESSKVPEMKDLCIDIGADKKSEAEAHVSLGDYAVFSSDYVEFGENRIKMKALDDRFGCAVLIKLLEEEIPYDMDFIFTVQEEVGSIGAAAASFNIQPDIAVIIETTTAGDICGAEGDQRVCLLGNGPVVSYMDRGTVYDMDLYKLAVQTAEESGIPCQTKTRIAGGNDSSAVQRTAGGARVLAVSAPTRYLHSPSDVMDKNDGDALLALMKALLPKLGEL